MISNYMYNQRNIDSIYRVCLAYLNIVTVEQHISKEDKVKQTQAVEKLIKDMITHHLSYYKDKVYLVGGVIRDKLLGINPKDLDLVVDDPKAKMQGAEIFVKKLANILGITSPNNPRPLKEAYGIWSLILQYPDRPFIYDGVDVSGYTIELAVPREEGPYNEVKREPSYVKYTTLENDALRRDLTVNSLYQNIVTGDIKDFTGGLEDLKSKILRPPGSVENVVKIYMDDPLRIFRIIRFSGKLNNFKIDYRIEQIIKKYLSDPLNRELIRKKVSKERIQDEFVKILKNPNSLKVIENIEQLKDYGLVPFISEELDQFIKGPEWNKTKKLLRETPPNLKVRLSALLCYIDHEGTNIAEKVMKDLKFPNEIINSVKNIIKNRNSLKDTKLYDIRKFIENVYDDLDEAIELIKAHTKDDPIEYKKILNFEKEIKQQKEKDLEQGILKQKKYISPLGGDTIKQYFRVKGEIIGLIKEKLKKLLMEGHFEGLTEKERMEKALTLITSII